MTVLMTPFPMAPMPGHFLLGPKTQYHVRQPWAVSPSWESCYFAFSSFVWSLRKGKHKNSIDLEYCAPK